MIYFGQRMNRILRNIVISLLKMSIIYLLYIISFFLTNYLNFLFLARNQKALKLNQLIDIVVFMANLNRDFWAN